jgi:hypothetical protein
MLPTGVLGQYSSKCPVSEFPTA